MNEKPVPYRRTIFVCTNARGEGERVSCGKRGEAICQTLKEEIAKRGLKGKIRAMKSGCHDLCEEGPNVMVFPENQIVTGVSLEDVPALTERFLPKSA